MNEVVINSACVMWQSRIVVTYFDHITTLKCCIAEGYGAVLWRIVEAGGCPVVIAQ